TTKRSNKSRELKKMETTEILIKALTLRKKQELEAKINANNEISTNKTQAITNINEAKTNANNEINNNQTQAIANINEAKESATTQINANKQEVLNNITQEKTKATSEITEAKKNDHYQNIDFFEFE
ncbi:hypothetical protein ACOWLW_07830, partial [Helicobacter pylori]